MPRFRGALAAVMVVALAAGCSAGSIATVSPNPMAIPSAQMSAPASSGVPLVGPASPSPAAVPSAQTSAEPTSTAPASAVLPPTACGSGVALKSGFIATIAGDSAATVSGGSDGGPALAASLRSASGTIAVDSAGTVYYGDTVWGSVRAIGSDGVIRNIADGFGFPLGVAMDSAGNLYLADQEEVITKIDPHGVVTTFAGTGIKGSSGNDGPATAAEINPTEIAIGPRGDLYFDDTNNYRTIDSAGLIHAFAGSLSAGFSGDGGPAVKALFGAGADGVNGVAAAPDGSVYLGDPGNHRIRKVGASGTITTVAGTGKPGSRGDGGPAIKAQVDSPHGIAVDAKGAVYFSDDGTSTVRRIGVDGIITTIAGTGSQGFSGDCGPAVSAQLNEPSAVAEHDGTLYILDSGNNRIRIVVP